MDRDTRVRRQALHAAHRCRVHIAVSNALRTSISRITGEPERLRVIPNAVDGSVFTLPAPGSPRSPTQILFVGVVREVKGVDVLLHAVRRLLDRGRQVRLVVVGESFYRSYRADHARVRRLAGDLGLAAHVVFTGGKQAADVARHMRESAVLVLPSRRESLGVVLMEALACGTPVVATRCGGPEDIVTPQVGVLVPPEDPEALARGIAHVLDHPADYDPACLRRYVLERFGLDSVSRRLAALYAEALNPTSPVAP
jgi:glycosyltransferase involved in cell wall biosynthesis